jgi:hypothetical protein
MGKELAGNVGKLRTSAEEHGPRYGRRPPSEQLRSSSDDLVGQELYRTARSKLPG